MERIKCSLWNNGQKGWGIKVLGGTAVRHRYFKREISPIVIELDSLPAMFNVDKDSFWTKTCGELIRSEPVRRWKEVHSAAAGDQVWLTIIEPYRRFRLDS